MAREAESEFEKGTPLKEIRDNIDKKYEGSGTNPTPTPLPKA
ncbi:hypothetical protein J7E71_23210 [Mesobacillus foraminis]|nr:hypothetical protein [Mesobacillus foraminis]